MQRGDAAVHRLVMGIFLFPAGVPDMWKKSDVDIRVGIWEVPRGALDDDCP